MSISADFQTSDDLDQIQHYIGQDVLCRAHHLNKQRLLGKLLSVDLDRRHVTVKMYKPKIEESHMITPLPDGNYDLHYLDITLLLRNIDSLTSDEILEFVYHAFGNAREYKPSNMTNFKSDRNYQNLKFAEIEYVGAQVRVTFEDLIAIRFENFTKHYEHYSYNYRLIEAPFIDLGLAFLVKELKIGSKRIFNCAAIDNNDKKYNLNFFKRPPYFDTAISGMHKELLLN